jgi:hypothetical protein
MEQFAVGHVLIWAIIPDFIRSPSVPLDCPTGLSDCSNRIWVCGRTLYGERLCRHREKESRP